MKKLYFNVFLFFTKLCGFEDCQFGMINAQYFVCYEHVIRFSLFGIFIAQYILCYEHVNRGVFTSTKMINQSYLYQNKKSIALVPKIFNWPKTIKPTTLSSWFKVAGGRATPLRGDNRL